MISVRHLTDWHKSLKLGKRKWYKMRTEVRLYYAYLNASPLYKIGENSYMNLASHKQAMQFYFSDINGEYSAQSSTGMHLCMYVNERHNPAKF